MHNMLLPGRQNLPFNKQAQIFKIKKATYLSHLFSFMLCTHDLDCDCDLDFIDIDLFSLFLPLLLSWTRSQCMSLQW